MYGVAEEKRPIFLESDAFLYNLDDPTYRDNPKIVHVGRVETILADNCQQHNTSPAKWQTRRALNPTVVS